MALSTETATPDPDTENKPASRDLRKVRALARRTALPAIVVILVVLVALDPGAAWRYLSEHVGLLIWAGLLLAVPLTWWAINFNRWSIIREPRKAKGREIKMMMRPLMRAIGEWTDAIVFQDKPAWRIAYLVLTVLAVATATTLPARIPGPPVPILITATGPAIWLIVIATRMRSITRTRIERLSGIRAIAAATLKYPRAAARVRMSDLQFSTWWSAVQVSEWDTLTEPRTFFVLAPPDLSVTDNKAWNEFEANLNSKLPRRDGDGWHVKRDSTGRGATISPANYPLSVKWEGQYDPDPLTFELGVSLDTFEPQMLTFSDASAHMIMTGATSSGKTSGAEIIVAQALLKPMRWDPNLRATCEIIDPKGPLASRWQGRPGVTVTDGANGEGYNEDGEQISGFELMTAHLDSIEKERLRRTKVLSKYRNAANWLALSDDDLRKEGLAPIFVVLDEYLDHTGMETSNGNSIVDSENAARARFTFLTTEHHRKARSVGIHFLTIMQTAAMDDIGRQMKRNAVVRGIFGCMDDTAYKGMFDKTDVPPLPTSRTIISGSGHEMEVTIPGRAYIQNATGQKIGRVQVYYFGGRENLDTLEKYLPRSEDPNAGVFGYRSKTAPSPSASAQPVLTKVKPTPVEAALDNTEPDLDDLPPLEPITSPEPAPVFPMSNVDDYEDLPPLAATDEPEHPQPTQIDDIPPQIATDSARELYEQVCEIASSAGMTVEVASAESGDVLVVFTESRGKVAEFQIDAQSVLTRTRVGSVAGRPAGIALFKATVATFRAGTAQ